MCLSRLSMVLCIVSMVYGECVCVCVCVCVCLQCCVLRKSSHLNTLTNHHSNRAASDLGSDRLVGGSVTDTLGQETDSSMDRVMYVGNSYRLK